ncbi:hypothetical protein ACMFMF_005494 [Clarireedia jacksonii]
MAIPTTTSSAPEAEANTFTHTHKIPTPATEKVSDRTAYLGALRKANIDMQERINKELTARMEEDKVREAGDANGIKKNGGAVDETKEEDNYGEEVVEEED